MTGTTRKSEADFFKGILTLGMILCHVLQFFGDEQAPGQREIVQFVNLITFSGFLFSFGYISYTAYLQKKFSAVWRKMLKNTGKLYAAYCLSGICFYALAERKIFSTERIFDVLLLRKFPGWSEFLIAFALMNLVNILLFSVLKRTNFITLAVSAALSFAACFIPYGEIHGSIPALLVGSKDFVTFPILQYSVYFVAGVLFAKQNLWEKKRTYLIGAVPTLGTLLFLCLTGDMPGRFPPHFLYIFGASFVVVLYFWAAKKFSEKKNPVVGFLNLFGMNSLFALLMSNLFIFGIAGSKFGYRDFGYAMVFYMVLIAVLWYLLYLVVRPQKMNLLQKGMNQNDE
ncbi:MAG: hypothetical protein RSC76_06055 [Oscillospiraceae bacterium]